MSAYRIAVESASAERRLQDRERGPGVTEAPTPEDLTKSVFDRLTKWIPGDTLAIYAPGVTLISSAGSPSLLFLLVMVIVTPLFVIGVAYSSSGIVGKQVLVAAGLSAVAFAIWSLSVPLNGWQEIGLIAANKGVTAVAAAVAGILFGYFAEGITRRISS
jgi:hypothetical protein